MIDQLLPRWDIKALVKALGAQERVLLFCVGSGTDWKEAGVTLKTVARLVVNFLVTPFPAGRLSDRCRPRRAAGAVARAMRRQEVRWGPYAAPVRGWPGIEARAPSLAPDNCPHRTAISLLACDLNSFPALSIASLVFESCTDRRPQVGALILQTYPC
jgi:hypothetical protein